MGGTHQHLLGDSFFVAYQVSVKLAILLPQLLGLWDLGVP